MGDSTTASEEAVTEAPPTSASPEESPANDWAKVYVGNLPNDLEEDGLRQPVLILHREALAADRDHRFVLSVLVLAQFDALPLP